MNKKVCLIGNPNVGKSSLFNILTHKHQHTGNWTGKTVENEIGYFDYKNISWQIIDLPGTYSLIGESEEEKIASKFITEKNYDVALVVADATNLERSLTLILEVLDITPHVIVALNLMDEAKKRNIKINVKKLSESLFVPVITTSMKENIGLEELCDALNAEKNTKQKKITHSKKVQNYINWLQPKLSKKESPGEALQKLNNVNFQNKLSSKDQKIMNFYRHYLTRIEIMESYQAYGKKILKEVVNRDGEIEKKEDKIWNFLLTNPKTSLPCFLILFFFLLFLTIYLSNIPSDWLFRFFQSGESILFQIFSFLPKSILEPLIYGGYRTLYWVVSVMLPPMMIFFPLFSLLEDYGLLPRIAFNLDKPFQACGSCGKQSLTMCMGLGCNAVGVTGARIMENKKMRILSILTNVFMPCNGRFPALIAMISMFFIQDKSLIGSILAAFFLLLMILFGILITFLATKLLNYFLFKQDNPIFIIELPSFRKPKVWQTIKNAWKEKAFHVLKRAMIISLPAGLIIYFLSNMQINGMSIFQNLVELLNPIGFFFGVDGVILLAFLLGIPANEIVIPILLLGYTSSNMLVEYESLESLKNILVSHGWTILTAINFMILSICHFPCATTILTIKKETKSWFYTFLAIILPTIIGLFLCFLLNIFR